MHRFTDLADRAATFALYSLNDVRDRTIEALQTSGATTHVKNLQMVSLSKAVFAIGLFSVFEAMLRDDLGQRFAFNGVRKRLQAQGDAALEERFECYRLAINVLKHGKGESYRSLLAKKALPFIVIPEDGPGDLQYDVSRIATLVVVDDAFVQGVGDVIRDVAAALQRTDKSILL